MQMFKHFWIAKTLIVYFFLISIAVAADEGTEPFTVAKNDDIYMVKKDEKKKRGGSGDDDSSSTDDFEEDRFYLQLNLASYHPGGDEDEDGDSYNEFNRGIGFEYHWENFYSAGGYFYNSIRRNSFYLGLGHERPIGVKWFGVGILGGLITGYSSGQSPRLAAVSFAYFKKDRFTLKAHYIPQVGDVEDDAIGFALRIGFADSYDDAEL